MLQRMDVRVELEDLGVRSTPIFSGMRLTIRIKDDYMTTGVIEFEEEISGDGNCRKSHQKIPICSTSIKNTNKKGNRERLPFCVS